MQLRKLKDADAMLMYEWMSDADISKMFYKDFLSYSVEDARRFIKESDYEATALHLAIASDEDEYMGTVTLKHIDWENKHAELSIVIRKSAMNRGYAWFATREILDKAFQEMELESVYWCVRKECSKPIAFFDKHGIKEVVDLLDLPEVVKNRYEGIDNLKWYSVLKGDDYTNSVMLDDIEGGRIVKIKTIPTIDSGELSFFESIEDIDFEIKRIYYISKVPEGKKRGFHAHKGLKQIMFCPYGEIEIKLDDGKRRREIILSDPSVAIVIEKPIWREMLWLKKGSVLCVAASDYYDEQDYIRDYAEFILYKEKNRV